ARTAPPTRTTYPDGATSSSAEAQPDRCAGAPDCESAIRQNERGASPFHGQSRLSLTPNGIFGSTKVSPELLLSPVNSTFKPLPATLHASPKPGKIKTALHNSHGACPTTCHFSRKRAGPGSSGRRPTRSRYSA